MKCMQVWAFSASFFKMVLWVLMLGKCPSKYTMNLVGGFYMRFNVLGPNCTRAPPPPTDHIVEETVFIQVDLVEQLVIEIRESPWQEQVCLQTDGLQNQLDEIRYGWKRQSPSLSLAKRVVRNPRFPLLPPPYESASRTRFPRVRPPGPTHSRCIRGRLIPLRDTSLSRATNCREYCRDLHCELGDSCAWMREVCSSFEWVLMHLQSGAPSKLLFR